MNTSSYKEKLLDKFLMCVILREVRDILDAWVTKNDRAVDLAYRIDGLIDETDCCITNWSALSGLYRRTYCLLERVLEFAENGKKEEIQQTMRTVKEAHAAAKPFVYERIRGNDTWEDMQTLGF